MCCDAFMRRPVTLSDRARGYGLWAGDILARIPGSRLQHVSFHGGMTPQLSVSLAISEDSSPLGDVPVHVVLTFDGVRVPVWRPSWRERLRRRPTDLPEVVELSRGRGGRFRILHTSGQLAVRASALIVDVAPAGRLAVTYGDAVAS